MPRIPPWYGLEEPARQKMLNFVGQACRKFPPRYTLCDHLGLTGGPFHDRLFEHYRAKLVRRYSTNSEAG